MMRGATSFHADEAKGKLGEERQNLRPPQRFADDDVSLRVDGMDLKDALGQIKPEGGDLHGGWLLYRVVAATAPLQGIRMPTTGAGAIHPICFQEAAKPISTTDMRRIAAIRNADNEGQCWVKRAPSPTSWLRSSRPLPAIPRRSHVGPVAEAHLVDDHGPAAS